MRSVSPSPSISKVSAVSSKKRKMEPKERIAGNSIMEPSYIAEFKEISSQYIVANKEDSE